MNLKIWSDLSEDGHQHITKHQQYTAYVQLGMHPVKKYFKYFESQDTALHFCIVISPTLLSSKVLLCIFLVLTYSHGNIISENLHGNVNLQLNRRVMKRAACAHNFAVVL